MGDVCVFAWGLWLLAVVLLGAGVVGEVRVCGVLRASGGWVRASFVSVQWYFWGLCDGVPFAGGSGRRAHQKRQNEPEALK